MAKQSMVSIATEDELCNWEIINHFDFEVDSDDDDDESICEVKSIDLVQSINSLSSSMSSVEDDGHEKEEDEDEDEGEGIPMKDINSCDHLDVFNCARVSDMGQNHGCDDSDMNNYVDNHRRVDGFVGNFDGSWLDFLGHGYDAEQQQNDDKYDDDDDDDVVDVDDDDDESDDGYAMDDELVPWEVKGRFMKQRIRKSGKNSFGRLAKSKKSALVFTRPGCVRDKHGLGLMLY